MPTFLEFFCGGGMARAGLSPRWRCAFANDIDARKGESYARNWGAEALRIDDIHALSAADLPPRADLAWASFPCQDLSLAGAGAGLSGLRSGAFFGFAALIADLARRGRGPRLIALENVIGALTASGGRDFSRICETLAGLGYRVGALTIDAALFVPQSRPRLFVVALRGEPGALASAEPDPLFASAALRRAHAALDPKLAERWAWWNLPAPPAMNLRFADLLEDDPSDAPWRSRAQTQALLAMMSETQLRLLAKARERGRAVGALYRRTRPDGAGGRHVRAEARFDGFAGCLRTPGGGSSRQFILIAEGDDARSRLLSGREAARLMGLPEDYRLPARLNDCYHLLGDGVVAPVVRHLDQHLLTPLLEAIGAARGAA